MKFITFLLLIISQLSFAGRNYVKQSSLNSFSHLDAMKSTQLQYFSDLFEARDVHTSDLYFMADVSLIDKEDSLSVLMAKAQFTVKYNKGEFDPSVINRDKQLNLIYDASVVSRKANNIREMKKSKMLVKIYFDIETFSYTADSTEFHGNEDLIKAARDLDDSRAEYIGSVVHKQRDFSMFFETNKLIANIYRVSPNEIAISAYSVSYIRNSAVSKLDTLLLWSSARETLNDEVENTLKTLFNAARKF